MQNASTVDATIRQCYGARWSKIGDRHTPLYHWRTMSDKTKCLEASGDRQPNRYYSNPIASTTCQAKQAAPFTPSGSRVDAKAGAKARKPRPLQGLPLASWHWWASIARAPPNARCWVVGGEKKDFSRVTRRLARFLKIEHHIYTLRVWRHDACKKFAGVWCPAPEQANSKGINNKKKGLSVFPQHPLRFRETTLDAMILQREW